MRALSTRQVICSACLRGPCWRSWSAQSSAVRPTGTLRVLQGHQIICSAPSRRHAGTLKCPLRAPCGRSLGAKSFAVHPHGAGRALMVFCGAPSRRHVAAPDHVLCALRAPCRRSRVPVQLQTAPNQERAISWVTRLRMRFQGHPIHPQPSTFVCLVCGFHPLELPKWTPSEVPDHMRCVLTVPYGRCPGHDLQVGGWPQLGVGFSVPYALRQSHLLNNTHWALRQQHACSTAYGQHIRVARNDNGQHVFSEPLGQRKLELLVPRLFRQPHLAR